MAKADGGQRMPVWKVCAGPASRRWRHCTSAFLLFLLMSGCNAESRQVGPTAPATAPNGARDLRKDLYEKNALEQSEGARLFRWSGCDRCHTDGAPGFADLADDRWHFGGSTPEIYRSIASGRPGMPAYDSRIGSQQLWQIAGYLHGLHKIKPAQRRRQEDAQQGEPSGSSWTGALR